MGLPTSYLTKLSKPVNIGNIVTNPLNISLTSKSVFGIKIKIPSLPTNKTQSSVLNLKNGSSLVKQNSSHIIPKHEIKVAPKIVVKISQKKTYQNYSEDKLNLSDIKIKNNSFKANEIDQGISSKRPELLMVFTYNPIFSGDSKQQFLSDFGKLIEVQHQTSYIKRDIIGELTLNIQKSSDESNAKNFSKLLNKFNNKIKDLDSLIGSYTNLIKNKEEIEKKFDIKNISGINTNEQESDKNVEVSQKRNPSIKEFFTKKMGYTSDQFDKFSNTKIFIQLISDLRNIIENYSFNLLGLKDLDRKNDISAIKIDTTYTINDDFTFTIAKLRSNNEPINAINRDFFNKTLTTLPTDPVARIKILINALSKEYRISSELGDPSNKKILDNFDFENVGSPFDNILGLPGSNIFIPSKGSKTLLELSQFKIENTIKQTTSDTEEEFFVLPFESKFIDFEKSEITYVPGKYYFADAIFETDKNSFNTKPLLSYEGKFSNRYNATRTALNTLLQLNKKNLLDSDTMFTNILNSCYSSINGISTDGNSMFDFDDNINIIGTDLNQAIIAGLFKLANEDTLLKNYLFQYLLLAGLSTNQTSETKIVWQSLIDEFQILDKFTALSLTKNTERDLKLGPNVVIPHLETLAAMIEYRALYLITKFQKTTSKSKSKSNGYFKKNNDLYVSFNDLKKDDIITALKIHGNWSTNSSNFCKEFLNLADKFTKAASIRDSESGYLMPDKSGRTRYNFISTSTQLLMLFEIFSSLIGIVIKIELSKSSSKGQISVRINKKEQRLIFDVLSEFVTSKAVVSAAPSAKNNTFVVAPSGKKQNKNVTIASNGKKNNNSVVVAAAGDKKPDFTNNYYYSIINDILTRLKEEDNVIIETLAILESIKENLIQAKEIAQTFDVYNFEDSNFAEKQTNYDSVRNYLTYLHNPNQKSIADEVNAIKGQKDNNLNILFKLYGMSAINMLSNITQIRNAAYIINNIKERALNLNGQNSKLIQNPVTGGQDNIIVANEVKNEIKDILFSYMATSDFTESNNAATRMKIMTVGIPNNFGNALQDRFHAKNKEDIGISSLQKKQIDVIQIKIYKRNLQYDELVFKPIKFMFDLSLYVSENDLILAKPENNELYENIIKRVSVTDYENPYSPEQYYFDKTQSNKKAITTEQKYSFLTNLEKKRLFKNHVASFLLQNFIYLSTGMSINEEHFLTRDESKKLVNTSFDYEFEEILKRYFRNTLKQNIPSEKSLIQIEKDPNVDKNVREIIKIYRSGNILTNPDKLMNKAFGAKFFDRIFHIPVNIDDFEIDIEKTKKTESGKKLLNKTFLVKNIITRDNKSYLKKRTDRDLILEDFFINIETVVS